MQMLWTFDDVRRFVHHPDHPVRLWALERLTNRFPDRAGDALVELLDDENTFIVLEATRFLSETGDRQRYGPILLEHLRRVDDERFGYYAEALAALASRDALPPILDRLRSDPLKLNRPEFIRDVGALGTLGGDEARQALWTILDHMPADHYLIGDVIDALLDAAQPEDIERLVQRYRDEMSAPHRNRMLEAFASACGVGRLYEEVRAVARQGFNAMSRRAMEWLGQPPQLSGESLDNLERAIRKDTANALEILLAEARRLTEMRGDDVAGWRAAWARGERPAGYRRQALMTLALLEALSALPASRVEQRRDENALGFVVLCQLSIDRDDAARLDATADKTEMLLTILAEDREHVLPDVVERVAALGPDIAPRLIDLIDPHVDSWGTIRVVDSIAWLARRYPGSCDAAVPLLVETVRDDQGDFLLEACDRALVAIGPPALEAVAEAMRDDDLSRQIYLTSVLAQIPTGRAAQALLEWIDSGIDAEEYHFEALKDIGHPAAIDLLYSWWQPGDYVLSEALLVLCEVNGIRKPELAVWREDVAEQDRRVEAAVSEVLEEQLAQEGFSTGRDKESVQSTDAAARRAPTPRREPGQPEPRPAPKHRGVSKKKRKKRAAQKKANKKKQRKK